MGPPLRELQVDRLPHPLPREMVGRIRRAAGDRRQRNPVAVVLQLELAHVVDDAAVQHPLAVMGDSRYQRAPDVPAVTEAFPGYKLSLGFFAFYGPLGLPAPIVQRFAGEVQKAFKDPETIAKLEAIDVQAVGNSPEEFVPFLNAYVTTIADLVKAAGLQPQ